jgi:hypothetical protein
MEHRPVVVQTKAQPPLDDSSTCTHDMHRYYSLMPATILIAVHFETPQSLFFCILREEVGSRPSRQLMDLLELIYDRW